MRTALADLLRGDSFPSANNSLRRQWNDRFERWAKPLSLTEKQKCENAESVVRSALDHDDLVGLNLGAFAQGSYKTNTNVRADSDVDIRVQCSNTFHYDFCNGITPEEAGTHSPAILRYPEYRAKIKTVLQDRFQYDLIDGNKAFNIKENTYRITVDIIPTFDYRLYYLSDKG